jgi:translation initiation factor IF-2
VDRRQNRRKAHRALEQAREQAIIQKGLQFGDEGFVPNEVPIILNVDLDGMMEPIEGMLATIPADEVKLKIVLKQVGDITERDVMQASATGATIVGFNAKMDKFVSMEAENRGVKVLRHSVISELLEAVKAEMSKHLPERFDDVITGTATVLQVFSLNAKGKKKGPSVAGCRVTSGSLVRSNHFRVVRQGVTVHEVTEANSIRHFKEQTETVDSGHECGVTLHQSFHDIKDGDVIECFTKVKAVRRIQ